MKRRQPKRQKKFTLHTKFFKTCTGIEEIIDIIEDNYFSEESKQATSAAASSSTFDATLLQAVKEIVNNQVESLQRIAAQQQESLKDPLSANNVSASEAKLQQLDLKPNQMQLIFESYVTSWMKTFNLYAIYRTHYGLMVLHG